MKFEKTRLKQVLIGYADVNFDERGCFWEAFQLNNFLKETGIDFKISQMNRSISRVGTLRGLHFSTAKESQFKWVECLRGSILDVAVDINPNSSTYLEYELINLSESDAKYIFLGDKVAHGFLALEDDTIVNYLLSSPYRPTFEHAINVFDSTIGISWPTMDYTLSQRDKSAPSFLELKERGVI